MNDSKQPAPQDNNVQILPPEYSLKEKIGKHINLRDIFTPERIAAAQQIIDDTQAEFINWAQQDLTILEEAYRTLEKHIGNADVAAPLTAIRKTAFSLKCQSGTFGFTLGSDVAKSLYDYSMHHERYTQENLAVIRKHIDALHVILHQNIQGSGAQLGEELMDNLRKLVSKVG